MDISKSIVRGYVSKTYDKLLDTLVDAEMSLTKQTNGDENDGTYTGDNQASITNTELMQQIAGSLLNASIEKMRHEKGLSETKDTDNEIDTVINQQSVKDRDHFVDIFLDRLISRMIPDKLPEREHFNFDIEIDPSDGGSQKKSQPPVSATILASNMKKLTNKMDGMFELQDSIVRLLTWRNPSGTMTLLILFTIICYNPMYLVLLPMLYIMYGIITPNYIRNHPFRRNIYYVKKKYGISLLETITYGGLSSRSTTALPPIVKTVSHGSNEIATDSDLADTQEINAGLQVILNLRDLQNMTTGTVHLTESLSRFINETAAFKDERKTSMLFFGCLVFYIMLKLISRFINWCFLLSLSIWSVFIAIHPKVRPTLSKYMKSKKDTKRIVQTNRPVTQKQKQEYDIVLDETPVIKHAEIFEIYRQGLVPGSWVFFMYSNHVFDPTDDFRKGQQPPPGVKRLEDIEPPADWSFDSNSSWETDNEPEKWSVERGLDLPSEGEFLCDSMFKRKRLIRRIMKISYQK